MLPINANFTIKNNICNTEIIDYLLINFFQCLKCLIAATLHAPRLFPGAQGTAARNCMTANPQHGKLKLATQEMLGWIFNFIMYCRLIKLQYSKGTIRGSKNLASYLPMGNPGPYPCQM